MRHGARVRGIDVEVAGEDRQALRIRRLEVAFVDDGATHGGQALAESGDANGRRAHVDAAAAAAEVERDAMNVDQPAGHQPRSVPERWPRS